MTIILAIDTAMTGSSVAIARDGEVVAEVRCPERGVQASQLLLHIEDCLSQASLTYDALDKIAVCIGPGGFTGIRVGLAAARGIALAADTPITGFTSLECMLCAEPSAELAVFNGGRGQYYLQQAGKTDIATVEVDKLSNFVSKKKIISSEELDIEQSISIHNPQNNASLLCQLAKVQKGRAPEPVYVRAPDAKVQKKLLG